MKIYYNVLTAPMRERLCSLIGQKFIKFTGKKSNHNNKPELPIESCFYFSNDKFVLKNDYCESSFLCADGESEDYNIFSIEDFESDDKSTCEFFVNEKIVDIKITTDSVHCFDNNLLDEIFVTDVAITFCLETKNITFYRSIWFSPFIDIDETDCSQISCMPIAEYADEDETFKTEVSRNIATVFPDIKQQNNGR